jgi:hypothetical protein
METLFLMSLIWTSPLNGLAPWTWFLVTVSQTAAAKKLGSWIGRLCLLFQECLKWTNSQRGLTTLGQSHTMANPMIPRVLNPLRIPKQETVSQGCSTYMNYLSDLTCKKYPWWSRYPDEKIPGVPDDEGTFSDQVMSDRLLATENPKRLTQYLYACCTL